MQFLMSRSLQAPETSFNTSLIFNKRKTRGLQSRQRREATGADPRALGRSRQGAKALTPCLRRGSPRGPQSGHSQQVGRLPLSGSRSPAMESAHTPGTLHCWVRISVPERPAATPATPATRAAAGCPWSPETCSGANERDPPDTHASCLFQPLQSKLKETFLVP